MRSEGFCLDEKAVLMLVAGNPKGVVLTHETVTKGIICQASGMGDVLQNWVLMSYLPLAHMSVLFFVAGFRCKD